ncbi:hypothetical protein M514_08054, partial [Trichuris suis]
MIFSQPVRSICCIHKGPYGHDDMRNQAPLKRGISWIAKGANSEKSGTTKHSDPVLERTIAHVNKKNLKELKLPVRKS